MRVMICYLAVGLLMAYLCDRKIADRSNSTRITSAFLAVVAWPLWGPAIWLEAPRPPLAESSLTQRVRAALDEARTAVVGTALASLLPEALLNRSYQGLLLVERRHAQLSLLLRRPEFREPSGSGAHVENVRRLHLLEQRDRRTLVEMAELAEALRTQLLVARFGGHGAERQQADGDGALGLVSELSARVESMDAWFELEA